MSVENRLKALEANADDDAGDCATCAARPFCNVITPDTDMQAAELERLRYETADGHCLECGRKVVKEVFTINLSNHEQATL
jgi:hypothetical protein